MSKVKLTGESSGYVEISAGTAAGNNTLELPTSGDKIISNNYVGVVTASTFSGDVTVGTGATISGSTDTIIASTNGSERLRISSDGTFYLGGYLEATTNNNTVKKIAVAPYNWTGGSTAEIASIEMGILATGSDDGNIIFKTATNVNSGGTLNEAMKIQYDGNIGAGGITTPTFTTGGGIHLGDAYGIGFGNGDNGRPDFQIVYDTGQNNGLQIRCGNGADTADVYFTTAGNLAFASGKGIDFSAASGSAAGSTSALLDDYEEGTFTPRISVESQGSDAAIDNVSGTYVKVGQLVHCTFNADLNGIPAGRGTGFAWQWGGLPFSSLAEGSDGSEDYIGSVRVANADHTSTYGVAGEFILRLFDNNTGGRIEAMRASNGDVVNASLWMKDNTAITGSITYRTS